MSLMLENEGDSKELIHLTARETEIMKKKNL